MDISSSLTRISFDQAFEFCESGEWDILNPLAADLSRLVDGIGRTLLMKAAMQQKSGIVRSLVEREIGIRTPDQRGKGPLHYLAFGAAGISSPYYYSLISEKLGALPVSLKDELEKLKSEGNLRQSLFNILLKGEVSCLNAIRILQTVIEIHSKMFECFDHGALQYMWLLQMPFRVVEAIEEAKIAKEEYERWFSLIMGFVPTDIEAISQEALLNQIEKGDDFSVNHFLKSCPTRYVIQSNQIDVLIRVLCALKHEYSDLCRIDMTMNVMKALLLIPEEGPPQEFFMQLYVNLGITYIQMNMLKEAEVAIERATSICELKLPYDVGEKKIGLFPAYPLTDYSDLYIARGMLFHRINRLDKAEASYKQVVVFYKQRLAHARSASLEILDIVSQLCMFLTALNQILRAQGKLEEVIEVEKESSEILLKYIDKFSDLDIQDYEFLKDCLTGPNKLLPGTIDWNESIADKSIHLLQSLRDISKDPSVPGNIGERISLQGIAGILTQRGELEKALESYMELYNLSKKNCYEHAIVVTSIGQVHFQLGHFETAAKFSQEACDLFAIAQSEIPHDEWRISGFKNQADAYSNLETALIQMGKLEEALVISDKRRALALCDVLSKRVSKPEPIEITLDKMHEIARECHTTFVVYSKNGVCWVIGKEAFHVVPMEMGKISLSNTGSLATEFPYRGESRIEMIDDTRAPSKEERIAAIEAKFRVQFHANLKAWYQELIMPIAAHLPKDSLETVTFVLDGEMSILPFAIFETAEGRYFIEDHPLLVAPSIKALSLLAKLREERGGRDPLLPSLVIGNPLTAPKRKLKALSYAQKEGEAIAALLGTVSSHCDCLLGKAATVKGTLDLLNPAGWIHIACHGDYSTISKADALYKGALYLAQDESGGVSERKGEDESEDDVEDRLFAEDISQLELEAELVFLSACYSGRGNMVYMHEGIVGMTRAFIAGGALAIVSSLWKLPDTEETVNMVKRFYSHILENKLNKAQALQATLIETIREQRDIPDKWGSLFLTGLS